MCILRLRITHSMPTMIKMRGLEAFFWSKRYLSTIRLQRYFSPSNSNHHSNACQDAHLNLIGIMSKQWQHKSHHSVDRRRIIANRQTSEGQVVGHLMGHTNRPATHHDAPYYAPTTQSTKKQIQHHHGGQQTTSQYNIRPIYKTPNNSIQIEKDPPRIILGTPRKRLVKFVSINSSRAYDMTKSAEVRSCLAYHPTPPLLMECRKLPQTQET